MIPHNLHILLHPIHRDQRRLQRVRIHINLPRFARPPFHQDESPVSCARGPARFHDAFEREHAP